MSPVDDECILSAPVEDANVKTKKLSDSPTDVLEQMMVHSEAEALSLCKMFVRAGKWFACDKMSTGGWRFTTQ